MSPTDHLNRFIGDRGGYSWRKLGSDSYELISGLWRDGLWRHQLVVLDPPKESKIENRKSKIVNPVILYVTGGDVNDPDLEEAQKIADR